MPETEKRGQLRGQRRPGRSETSPSRETSLRPRSAPIRNVQTTPPARNGPRILFLDIETAPLQSYHWGLWDQNIGLEQIGSEWSILSFAAKWLGTRKVVQHDTGGQSVRRVRDDRRLLRELWSLLDEADIVVGQNAKKFDVRKVNARLLMSGFKPYSPIKVVDTMLIARRHFEFTSNKLAWLSKHLTPSVTKLEHREFPGFELWAACLRGDPRAWQVMRRYNIRDVVALEPLYLKLRPWAEGHPNVAVYSDSDEVACPKCGSTKLKRNGSICTQTGQYQRYRCLEPGCGGFSRSRYTQNTISKRRSLLSN